MNTGCILMAAGAAARFGENKLLRTYRGKPVYLCAMDAIPFDRLSPVAVVSGTDAVLEEAAARGFLPVRNDRPQEGVSRTIRLGLAALGDVDAALFMVCDQPALTRESVYLLLDAQKARPHGILRLCCGEVQGNPVLFPGEYFCELCALTGDHGGSAVLRAHPDALHAIEIADGRELCDIDEPEALARLNQTT